MHVQIDQQIIANRPYRAIIAMFPEPRLTLGGINRHREKHLREVLGEAIRQRAGERTEHGCNLVDRVGRLADRAEKLLAVAESKSNITGATGALNACVRVLELIAKLTGELQPANTGGIHLSLTKVSNTTVNYNDDGELAQLIAEATRNFDPGEIDRLRNLVESQPSPSLHS